MDVVLLGDSITQGLGSKKINYAEQLQVELGGAYAVTNLAQTGKTIQYSIDLLESGLIPPGGIIVVCHGNVDAQIRPSRTGRVYPHIPSRFRLGGMLSPRPFYSSDPKKRCAQHVDNAARYVFNHLIRAVDGIEQWVPLEEYVEKFDKLLCLLKERGCTVVCCSTVYIDEKLFPGSQEQYELFNAEMEGVCHRLQADYVDLYGFFRSRVEESGWNAFYNSDHFHPNADGYLLMAREIAGMIKASCQRGADESTKLQGLVRGL